MSEGGGMSCAGNPIENLPFLGLGIFSGSSGGSACEEGVAVSDEVEDPFLERDVAEEEWDDLLVGARDLDEVTCFFEVGLALDAPEVDLVFNVSVGGSFSKGLHLGDTGSFLAPFGVV